MKKFKILTTAIVMACISFHHSYSQGCSDAGFCTINSFKPSDSDSTKVLNKQFKIGTFAGDADNSIFVYGSYFEFNKQLNKRFGFDVKLTTLAQSGNGISAFGLSDFYINTNYAASEKLKLTLGFKVPLSNANKTHEGLPLPMDYQASLGTFDLIFGIGYEIKKIQLVAAIQQPLTQNNNQFFASNFSSNTPLSNFQSTN